MSYQIRVWIAGASGRLGHALCEAYENNSDFKLLKSDKEVPVENLEEVLLFCEYESS